ncbi:MAG: hypothetical protein KAI24_03985 [Planctomycetes bacterium]|nr:hypothetical protein [Planctomycetota bacterium]
MRPRLLLVLAVLAPALAVAAQSKALAEFEKRRTRALAENGQRHLRLGSWARDAGLVPQATAEFLLAVEVAEGKNPGALKVLGIMRSLDERFWTKRRERPTRRLLALYEKKARKALQEDRKERFAVAKYAHGRKLGEQALREFRAIAATTEGPLVVDDRGRIVLDVGKVPAEVSAKLLEKTVAVDEQRYLADEATAGLPDGAAVHEHASDGLRVRGTLPKQRLADLHALGEALLPQLEAIVGGRPVQRVKVFVFATRAEYATYLATRAMQSYRAAGGFADYGSQQAIVCAEGCDEDGLRGLFLHELAHLFDYQVAPAAFPSWYREALAESVGGRGAWRWVDGALTIDGRMSKARRAELAAGIDDFSLPRLLQEDAGALFASDAGRAHRFYVEAWGLLEFLRHHAGDNVASRLQTWENMCRGKAAGASPRSEAERRSARLDEREAREMFEAMFGSQLDELQRGFVDWVRGGD